jgi:hypothetical protein
VGILLARANQNTWCSFNTTTIQRLPNSSNFALLVGVRKQTDEKPPPSRRLIDLIDLKNE